MVKKTVTPAKQAATTPKKEEIKAEEPEEIIEADAEDSLTVKQKKENAQRFLKSVKKMNAKVKSSLERKQIMKAVQAL